MGRITKCCDVSSLAHFIYRKNHNLEYPFFDTRRLEYISDPYRITANKSSKTGHQMKKGKTYSNSLDIERGNKVHADATSDGLGSIWDYVPCIIEQDDENGSDEEVNQIIKESIPVPVTRSSLKIAPSESFFDDSKPPPMAIAASTSETDEDDETIHNISKEQLLTDPFAPREGRTLCWRNVNMTLVRLLIFCVTVSMLYPIIDLYSKCFFTFYRIELVTSPNEHYFQMYGERYQKPKRRQLWVHRGRGRHHY
jgi:hypothetical protein